MSSFSWYSLGSTIEVKIKKPVNEQSQLRMRNETSTKRRKKDETPQKRRGFTAALKQVGVLAQFGERHPRPQHYCVAALHAVGFELATKGCQLMQGDVADYTMTSITSSRPSLKITRRPTVLDIRGNNTNRHFDNRLGLSLRKLDVRGIRIFQVGKYGARVTSGTYATVPSPVPTPPQAPGRHLVFH